MLESLLCNSCGAPLEVPSSAKFVKCNHCNTTLRVHRSSGATTTETIERLTETAEGLAEQLERLTQQNKLEALDRNWHRQQQSFAASGLADDSHSPAPKLAWIGGAGVVFFGILWTILSIAITWSAPSIGPFKVAKFVFPLFGIGFIALGIYGAFFVQRRIKEHRKSYREAEQTYRHRRESILQGDE